MRIEPTIDNVSRQTSSAFDVVAVAASAGGLTALSALLGVLVPDFPAPILIVQHRSPHAPDLLARLLGQRTSLPVRTASDGNTPQPGTVYVAAPGRHLQVGADGRLAVTPGPRVQWSCPSADVLFASVARHHGSRAIGVVLTGRLRDGVAGAQEIKKHGGRILVQEPVTAAAAGMPNATLRTGCTDLALPPSAIGHALVALAMVPGAESLLRVAPMVSAAWPAWLAGIPAT